MSAFLEMSNALESVEIPINKLEKIVSLCRICLTENPDQSKSLYELQDSMPASEKVMLCTGVQMQVTDGLPKIICEHCFQELEVANGFRIKCEYSDSLLKKFYNNGVLNESSISVKKEIIVPCEPWIKFENDSVGDDALDDFSCDGSLSETTNTKIKKVLNNVKNTNNDDNWIISSTGSSKSLDDSAAIVKPNCRWDIGSASTRSAPVEKANKIIIGRDKKKTKSFCCDVCNKPLTNKRSLEHHTVTVHSEKKNHLRSNITGYGANKRFHCTECEYTTPRRQALNYHLRTHTGEKPYECDICHARFSQPGSLVSHTRRHSDTMHYACPECGKQFKYKQAFERHKFVHSPAKDFICIICNKGLKNKETLQNHTNRHLNIRNYSCDACGATFVAKTDLRSHAQTHTATKKYECNICQFRTRLKSSLKKHIARHTGEKKFKCELCDHTSFNAGNLTIHMRKHTREKRYSCPVCEVKMVHSTSVNVHMLRTHGIKYTVNSVADRRIIK